MSLSSRLGWATQVKTSLGYVHNKFQASPSYNSSKFTYEDVQAQSVHGPACTTHSWLFCKRLQRPGLLVHRTPNPRPAILEQGTHPHKHPHQHTC